MSKPSAKVICHSKNDEEELITLEIELHRFILPEFNTHRTFSRNFQSSRAVPVEKMIDQVRTNPATPVHWGKNQRGMVAEVEVDNSEDVKLAWVNASQVAANQAEVLNSLGVHKQVVNRILEPFMWTKGVVTATREAYDAFFLLRCHKDAQPEIQALANAMKNAIEQSVPTQLEVGDYHLPYVEVYKPLGKGKQRFLVGDGTSKELTLEQAIKVSASCCAQVSYRNLDQSIEKAEKIYNMLNLPVNGKYPDNPPHLSPAEHIALVCDWREWYDATMGGNFVTMCFWQYRKALERGEEALFMSK